MWKLIPSDKSDCPSSESEKFLTPKSYAPSDTSTESDTMARPDSPLSGTSSVLARIRFRSVSDTDGDSDASGDSGQNSTAATTQATARPFSELVTPTDIMNEEKKGDYTDPCCMITCCNITCCECAPNTCWCKIHRNACGAAIRPVKNIKVLIFLNIFPVYAGKIHKSSICLSVGKLRSSKFQWIETIISQNVNFLKSHCRYCKLFNRMVHYSLVFRSTRHCYNW